MRLNEKQVKFCEEYLIDLNATQAAIRAGYSKKTAAVIGSENLIKPYIQEKLLELRKNLSSNTGITPEMVIKELALIGFNNIRDFVDPGNSIVDITTLDKNLTAAISSIKSTILLTKEGPESTTEIKMHSKISALELIGKHLGLFEKDNNQKKADTIILNFIKTEIGHKDD